MAAAAAPDASHHHKNISDDEKDRASTAAPEKPFLWGELSVGPVWKSRLVAAGYPKPTPIQVASYANLSTKKNQISINGNAVIAASTGSGKSLAYLLPFLTSIDTNNRKKKSRSHQPSTSAAAASVTSALGKLWVVTPTMELAYQLQRTVDKVIAGQESSSSSGSGSNVLHVLEYNRGAKGIESDSSFSASFPILSDIVQRCYTMDETAISQEPTFLAGTPKLFVQMRKEIKKVLASTTKLDSNLRFAKQQQARKLREAREGRDGSDENVCDDDAALDEEEIVEQLLYRRVALALRGNLETLILDEVDRLLQTTTAMARREHKTTKPLAQELLEALVWDSSFSREASGKRRFRPPSSPSQSSSSSKLQIVCASATIGRSLRRQLMYIIKAPSMDKAAVLITADVRTKKNAELRRASLLPSNLKHSYRIVPPASETTNATLVSAFTLRDLVDTLQTQDPPAPALIFPGTIGVETVRDHLLSCGFTDVRGLSSLRSGSSSGSGDNDKLSPMNVPVYVVKERLARGLDLPEVRRVVLLGVPNNAAAYTHLAGRTARQNNPGECTVVCRPSEAHKLVSIAETLGLYQWECLCESTDENASETITEDSGDELEISGMTKTAIKSKKVPELQNFLESKGVSTNGLLKDALVDAVLELKDGSEQKG
jgi:superfamily II DNA/RNA helicase